ncbi:MAG: glycosyltransferase [Aeromicrobium erythreum]
MTQSIARTAPRPQPALVSIVMPAFNAERYIADAIRSALSQTYTALELIIVDDKSSDRTVQVAREFSSDPRLRVIEQPTNLGPAQARNRALREARGRYIALLDADDVWEETKIQRQIATLSSSAAPLTYSEYDLIDEHGRVIGNSGSLAERVSYSQLLRGCIIQNSTVVYDTARTGGTVDFPDLRRRQDFAMFLQILKHSGDAVLTDPDIALCAYRITPGSVSSRKLTNIKFQHAVYREHEALGRMRSSILVMAWLVYAGRKSLSRRLQRGRNSFPRG